MSAPIRKAQRKSSMSLSDSAGTLTGTPGRLKPLLIGDPATFDDLGVNAGAIDLGYLQLDTTVINEDKITGRDVARESGVGGRDHVSITGHIFGSDDELGSGFEQNRPLRERAESDLRPLQVDEDPHTATTGVASLADREVGLPMHLVAAVREVQPGDVHTGIYQGPDLLRGAGRGPQGGHDFGSTHEGSLLVNGYTMSGRADARMGDGRLVVPIRYRSTLAAAARPSAIAHTMRD